MKYDIRNYGAAGDGTADDTQAIQAAVDACFGDGGGQVFCPGGIYMCSSVQLKSNVDLYLDRGCTIMRKHGERPVNHEYRALIEAKDAENISISGLGCIDGCSDLVFYDDNQDPMHEAPLDYPHNAFRPCTSFFENVKNITVTDITIRNSVFWTLHFAGCQYVIVRGVKILNNTRVNENDGIDPDCCKNVVISDCIITSGDDPVAIKTTREMTAKYGSSENITVNNCIFRTKSAAIKIGTETWADIKNINVSNCVIEECGRAVAIWVRDGANVENVSMSNVKAVCRAYNACNDNRHIGAGYPFWWGKGEAVYISNMVRNNDSKYSGNIKNISFDRLSTESESCVFICGAESGKIENVKITNSDFKLRKIGSQTPGMFDFRPSPYDTRPHRIPGIYANRVKDFDVNNVRIVFNDDCEAYSEAMIVENSADVYIDRLRAEPAKDDMPCISVSNTSNINATNIITKSVRQINEM